MKYIKNLRDITKQDIATVGGKTASLGEMIHSLSASGIRIPDGFAITVDAYRYFLAHNALEQPMRDLMALIADYVQFERVAEIGEKIRTLIEQGSWPDDLAQEITKAYADLSKIYHEHDTSVAVRSSATAEDLPQASFAGQQDTFLHVTGIQQLLDACKRCFASLFTDRAIVYRHEQHFDHFEVALAICVQHMVRSDEASAGVLFTLDTESGFRDVVSITAAYGVGESVVQGVVNPDEYLVYKKKLKQQYPVLQKHLGNKQTKIVYDTSSASMRTVEVVSADQKKFVLSDDEILELTAWGILIEEHYHQPMDIEWAKDGVDGKLYVVQARPETVYGDRQQVALTRYYFSDDVQKNIITSGQSIGQKIASGRARVIKQQSDLKGFQKGDILVTTMTDPDWVPIMKLAAGIVTDLGGRTCHAAIVSRELGVPAVIGTNDATRAIQDGQTITIDCSQGSHGFVYDGMLPFHTHVMPIAQIPQSPCPVMVNLADPNAAFKTSLLPVAGVGLARLEFIINTFIGIHPMAAVAFNVITDPAVAQKIQDRVQPYQNVKEFFIEILAQGVSMIVAAFYPRPVIVRLSDFKSNEYRNLLGGEFFEPHEENPMLGWRGAVRYTTPSYEPAFALECAALKKVRDMGFTNMKIMVPFVRTVAEAEKTCAVLASHGIQQSDGMELFMMVEVPSNVLLLEKFAPLFDGFSIGSNDLTQLTLGVDRDSDLLKHLFDERDEAIQYLLKLAIQKAQQANKYISICGQAPSDYPEIAQFLIEQGIDALSLNSDAVLPFLMRYSK